MEFGSCRLSMLLAFLCAFSLLVHTALAEDSANEHHDLKKDEHKSDTITRRQDSGFDFMNYFMGNRQQQNQQNPQQAASSQQQLRQAQSQQQPLTVQQQHQLQQQQLAQQQLQQQKQLQQLQQQQLLQLQQQEASRSNDAYQDNIPQQQQQNVVALSRDGGYGGIGIGGGYVEPQQKQIGISIGGGKPPNVIKVGNILSLLPRIMNVLSAGGKVMFGVELGNNFYFGPVGAKPLYSG